MSQQRQAGAHQPTLCRAHTHHSPPASRLAAASRRSRRAAPLPPRQPAGGTALLGAVGEQHGVKSSPREQRREGGRAFSSSSCSFSSSRCRVPTAPAERGCPCCTRAGGAQEALHFNDPGHAGVGQWWRWRWRWLAAAQWLLCSKCSCCILQREGSCCRGWCACGRSSPCPELHRRL